MEQSYLDQQFNLRAGGAAAESRHGIETLLSHDGFVAGEQALYRGQLGTIRRFVRYRGLDSVCIDFLSDDYRYTGIEATLADGDLRKVSP